MKVKVRFSLLRKKWHVDKKEKVPLAILRRLQSGELAEPLSIQMLC